MKILVLKFFMIGYNCFMGTYNRQIVCIHL